jgi:PEP-CTERM motif
MIARGWLLSTESTATDTLTVYDGVSYGFALSALGNASAAEALQASAAIPEPATWAMILFGLGGLAFACYRRAQAADAILARAMG